MQGFKSLFVISIIFIVCSNASGSNFGIGSHAGYGTFQFKENDQSLKSESTQNMVIFGVSGEYSFNKPRNFFAGITTDWIIGFDDRETWTRNNTQAGTNDMSVSGQFYDLRFGYKNSINRFYYRIYISGGWDGLYLERDNSTQSGVNIPVNKVTRDYSLWRAGIGTGIGYSIGKWALDGRAAYSYYPAGDIDDSSLRLFTFDTNGTCLDAGLGVARRITDKMSVYAGVSYTFSTLDKSETINGFFVPEADFEMLLGVVNLTYAF